MIKSLFFFIIKVFLEYNDRICMKKAWYYVLKLAICGFVCFPWKLCHYISYCQTHTFWSGRFWFLINIIAVCSSLSFNDFFMNRFQFPISHITKLSPLCFTIWRHFIDSFIFCSCCDWFNKIKLKSADENK